MFYAAALLAFSLLAVAYGQQVGTNTAETHPTLNWSQCKSGGTCTSTKGSIVLDANWRWSHTTKGYTNCYTGNKWDNTLCPDNVSCAKNCAVDGADYSGTYGITSSGTAVTLKLVTTGTGKNVGSRIYLLNSDGVNYQMFKPKNREITFDVNVSKLPCGINGAVYFSTMDADGGLSKYPNNKAGAKYGTGYCDAQCPHDIKFINGEANAEGWGGSANDPNAGTGKYGTCCPEMDLWEANSISTAYTPHACTVTGQTRCSGVDCGDDATGERYQGMCDKDGCDFNSYRMGDTTFYGPGKTVDTSQTITVVTQFITADGTDTGPLSEIRRVYVQNGKVIQNSKVNIPGMDAYDSITDKFCKAQKTAFGDTDDYSIKGGLIGMGKAFDKGVVLVMSIWDDHAANLLWLDSTYPTTSTAPGAARGTCATTSGVPAELEATVPNSSATYGNIKFGPIGSTYRSGGANSVPLGTSDNLPPTTPSPDGAAHWAQCGGTGYSGPATCVSPYKCTKINDWYSQCQ